MNRRMICTAFVAFCISGAVMSAQGGYVVQGTVADALGPVIGAAVVDLQILIDDLGHNIKSA